MMPTHAGHAVALTAAGAVLTAICYGMARFAYGLFLPVFRSEFGMSAATAGAIASFGFLAFCIGILISMLLTPRLGGRAAAVIAGGAAAAGMLLVATAAHTVVLGAGIGIAGFGTGLLSPALAHAVAYHVAQSHQRRAQTAINAAASIGIATAGGIALVAAGHWRFSWGVFAAVGIAATAWALFAVPVGPVSARSASILPRPLAPPGSLRLITAAALLGIASAAVWTFGRDALIVAGGMRNRESIAVWIFLGACGLLSAVAGDATRRFGIASAWRVTALLLAGSVAILGLLPSVGPAAWAAAGVFGLTSMGVSGVLLVWGIEVYPDSPATGVGLAFLMLSGGQVVGAALIGMLVEGAGFGWAFTAAALTAVLGACITPAAVRTPPLAPQPVR